MNQSSPLLDANPFDEDVTEKGLRPLSFADFTGQAQVKENLSIFTQAAKARQEALDHVLLYGPPGLGKTTLAHIVANEMGVQFKATSGPLITKAGDLAAILTNLERGDVLFIDEIHRLNTTIEEVLYPAMEDFTLDLIIGEGPSARTVKIDLPPFTLVGATTRLGLLSGPLRDRFGIPLRLVFYEPKELEQVLLRAARMLGAQIDKDAVHEIAMRSRGTPRIALRLLRRVRDVASVHTQGHITHAVTCQALKMLEVDPRGLDSNDRRYLRIIAEFYQGGPVGLDTLAAALSEQRDAIEETIEPFLLQQGFIQRTPRGRMLTPLAFQHLGIAMPQKSAMTQFSLLDDIEPSEDFS